MRHPLTALAAAGVTLLQAFACSAASATSVVTPLARDTLAIHNQFMVIITVLCVVVFAIMLYSMIRHRQNSAHASATLSGPRGLVQWIWILVPFAIILFIDFALMGM